MRRPKERKESRENDARMSVSREKGREADQKRS